MNMIAMLALPSPWVTPIPPAKTCQYPLWPDRLPREQWRNPPFCGAPVAESYRTPGGVLLVRPSYCAECCRKVYQGMSNAVISSFHSSVCKGG